jgi:hypothetical protein
VKPVNAVQIIREALATYGQHAATVLTVSLLINGVALIASILAMNMLGLIGMFVFLMITTAAQQVSNGAFAALMSSRWAGEELGSAQDVIRPALARVGALVGAAILYSLGVGIALLFFLLPGIYLMTRWAVVFPAIVIGRQPVGDAFKQSSQYTSQAMDSVFAVVLFNVLLSVVTPRLVTGLAGGENAPLEMVVIATFAISAIFGPISGLAIGELYLRLAPPVSAGGPTVGRGAWVPVAQQPQPAAANGPWVPMPAGAQPAMAAASMAAPAPYGAPAAPPMNQPSPYGAPPHQAPAQYGTPDYGAPAAYGAPGAPPMGQPAPYGAPPHQAPPQYGTPAPYGAPQPAASPYQPSPYAAPAQGAPAPYGAPAAPAGSWAPQQHHAAPASQPAAYGAPPASAALPGITPPAPAAYAAPPSTGALPGITPPPPGAPADAPAPASYATPPQPAAAPVTAPAAHMPPATPYAAPASPAPGAYPPAGAPMAAPPAAAQPGATYGAPPVGGAMAPGMADPAGPAGPRHPGREQSVAPPGLG